MKKFIANYYSSPDIMSKMATLTEEDKAQMMQAWFDWKAFCGDHIVDFGSPLMPAVALDEIAEQNNKQIEKIISGYSIVQANDLAHAKELFVNHPHKGGINLLECASI